MASGFVNVSLGTRGWPCADDAIAPASLEMDNVEHTIPQRSSDNHHPVGVGAVIEVDGSRVGEDSGCFGEGNAVFFKVRLGLVGIPFEIALDD
jgi:hypothetical protein